MQFFKYLKNIENFQKVKIFYFFKNSGFRVLIVLSISFDNNPYQDLILTKKKFLIFTLS